MVVLHFENDHPLEDAGEPLRPREDDRSCERPDGHRPESVRQGREVGAANAGRGESGGAKERDSTGAGDGSDGRDQTGGPATLTGNPQSGYGRRGFIMNRTTGPPCGTGIMPAMAAQASYARTWPGRTERLSRQDVAG